MHSCYSESTSRHAELLIRRRYDFTTTFEVIVGKVQGRQKRFPVYHELLTSRSNFLLSARTAEPQEPVHLEGEDPEVFSLYLNCVHSGIEAVRAGGQLLGEKLHAASAEVEEIVKREAEEEQNEESDHDPDGSRFEALIRLYLLASNLQDFGMMNMAVNELIRMVEEDGLVPAHVDLVYSSTVRGSLLRTLIRDIYVHEAGSPECHEFLQSGMLHYDFWRDISQEYFRLKDSSKSVKEVFGLNIGKDKRVDRCHYHQPAWREAPAMRTDSR